MEIAEAGIFENRLWKNVHTYFAHIIAMINFLCMHEVLKMWAWTC